MGLLISPKEIADIAAWSEGKSSIGEWPVEKLLSHIAALEAKCSELEAVLAYQTDATNMWREHVTRDLNRIGELEAALKVIASYDPGKFRPLEDEIAIHKIATTALRGPAGHVSEAPTTFLEDVMEHDSVAETGTKP